LENRKGGGTTKVRACASFLLRRRRKKRRRKRRRWRRKRRRWRSRRRFPYSTSPGKRKMGDRRCEARKKMTDKGVRGSCGRFFVDWGI